MTDTVCNWTPGVKCAHELPYWSCVGMTVAGGVLAFVVVFCAALISQGWEEFWSSPKHVTSNIVIPLSSCLIGGLVMPKVVKGGLLLMFFEGIMFTLFLFGILGPLVRTYASIA